MHSSYCSVALLVPLLGLLGPATSAEDTDDSADRRRLLVLEDGRVLRARSRLVDGAWQTRSGSAWVDVGGAVARARLEREAVAEARRRAGEVKRDDRAGRVMLAGWMLGEGLYEEALTELDRVLDVEPDCAAALAAIEEHSIPLELSEKARANEAALMRELILTGARGSRAVREVAARRLTELSHFVDLRQVVGAEMRLPQDGRREFAVLAARRLFPGELSNELSTRAILDRRADVRLEACRALRDANDVAVLGPAITALNSERASVRASAAAAMGHMGYAAAVEPLMAHLAAQATDGSSIGHRAHVYLGSQTAYVMDYDVEIAQAASIADPVIGFQHSGAILDVRAAVQMTVEVELRTTMASLRRLTRAQVESSVDAWLSWWEEHQAAWRSLDHAESVTRVQ